MKVILVLTVFVSMASIILSSPQRQVARPLGPFRPAVDEPVPIPVLPEETKEEILEFVAEKMDAAYPNLFNEVQTRTNLFNLSAYLNTGRPANGTAVTFVPLITLLSAFFTGSG